MSILYECNDETIWDVASGIGRLYYSAAVHLGEMLDVAAGLRMPGDDTCQIEAWEFGRYAQIAFDYYLSSGHPILHGLIYGQIVVTVVLADQIGRPVQNSTREGRSLLAEAAVYARSMGA